MLHYAHAFFNQVAQSAACNHFHSVEQRCCRWLLMTHDRVQSERFLLTQEFLGMMLGVRRTSVTAAASMLKRRKLIEYRRGQVTILIELGSKSARASAMPLANRNSTACSDIRSGRSAAEVDDATSKIFPTG